MLNRKQIQILLVLLLFAGTALAHMDKIITVRSNGLLIGLPAEYEPACLKWSGSKSTLRLRIGNHETVLPKCLTSRLSLARAEIAVHASWYHKRSSLPPYIAVDIIHSIHKDSGFFSGYSLLFNLDTGEIISIGHSTATDSWQQNKGIDIAALCNESEIENMVRPAYN